MYLMYIDESGDTIPISQRGKKFLVLTGCIIHENDMNGIEEKFREIKYDKKPKEYWRFIELSLPKLYKSNGEIDGFGLKFFPDKTKKDLRFFS